MQKIVQSEADAFLAKKQRRRLWTKVVSVLGCVVVFCTTYALILPAITAEKTTCGLEEHTHTEECYAPLPEEPQTVLNCTVETLDVHSHTAACYDAEGNLICGLADYVAHSHDENCYNAEGELVCTLPENPGHVHTEACYAPIEEGHVHDDACYELQQGELICGLEENDEHQHSEDCYEQLKVLVCPLAEQAPVQPELICGQPETITHQHTESCFETVEPVRELICELPEHVHSETCYDDELTPGDPTADLETAADWEASFSSVTLTGEYREDLVAIAESQLGYHESTLNFIINEAGVVNGYTRYGQWFGIPYGDWCAMFVSFCLRYAEVPNFPFHSRCNAWIEALDSEEYGLYRQAGDYEPEPGDVIFFDLDGDKAAEHVGIVAELIEPTETEPARLRTIEGNAGDAVRSITYEADSDLILGFGVLPEKEAGYSCEKVSHLHTDYCYNTSPGGRLLCPFEEHSHSEQCFVSSTASETLQQRIDDLIREIDALPTNDEIEDTLNSYDEAGDEEGYEAYYLEVARQTLTAYAYYEDLGPELQEQITNRDKLLEMAWLWSAQTLAITDTLPVYQVNTYSQAVTTIAYGGSVGNKVSNNSMSFTYWDAIVVEKNSGSGKLYVAQYVTADGDKRDYKATTADGFVLLLYNTPVNTEVGQGVTVNFDYKSASGYSASGFGTVQFGTNGESGAAQKPEKDNSSKLTVIQGANTRDLIEVNLYDYGTNINDLYKSNHNYPGFQQEGGSTNVGDSFSKWQSFNFGNNITSDLAAGIAGVTNQGGAINATTNGANSPISGAMKAKLGSDGYPALSDGTSLGYLFSNSAYAAKQNSQSINGLFLYHEDTGAYTFNSRENHAQFNSGSDTFTLYDQILSSNFMMYPFGNFLPFNDIVHLSAQASEIDRTYLEIIANSAQYKFSNSAGDEYGTLATQLKKFITLMDNAYPSGWAGVNCMNEYFKASGIPRSFSQGEDLVQKLYSIDYDEPTDFYFGMEMKMNFMQPKGGLTGKNGQQPMVFYFTGDDDVWVYIDGVLFLDLSGIHRHVGGEIDFVNGKVRYYSLDISTGDVSTTPYKTVNFSELVAASLLNEKGTFKDYSSHSFNFYYMERGSGSGVCRMNFNFPLLRKNTISVTKELTVDEQDKLDLLGNPDFSFQVLKADNNGNKTTELFIGAGVNYKIYNGENEQIGTGTTDANGVFTLKAGQRAEFEGIAENSGQYYVRELLDTGLFEQYGAVYVDGTSQTTNYDVTVGSDTFKGLDSTVKDMSDGSTVFHFSNQVTFNKLGSLEISKVLNTYPQTRSLPNFDFEVTLDGVLLPAGTTYTVDGETRTVSSAGIVTVPAGATAKISNILAGSKFTVKETALSSAGYTVTYSGTGVTSDGTSASGTILVNSSVQVIVTNNEKGTSVDIPAEKTVSNPDGTERTFRFKLVQVTGQNGETPVESGAELELSLSVKDMASGVFTLSYLEKDFSALPATFYYKITELADGSSIAFDESVYVAEITVSSGEEGITAALTKLWKDGTEVAAPLQASFTNTLLRDLTVQKVVSGMETGEKFRFEIELKNGDSPLNGTFRTTLPDGTGGEMTFTEGKAQFELGMREVITIHGLPDGAAWTITETGADGYLISWQIGDNNADGASANGTVGGSNTITCTNTAVYELPDTGGAGMQQYITGGLLLITAAGLLLSYIHFKRRKEENSSF